MRLIVITGMPGAGKEEFLNVAREMGMPFVRMGDVVREYHSRDVSHKDVSTGEFANSERIRNGYDIWAKRCLEKMIGSVFIIDGCRSMDEVNEFRSLSGDVVIVAIHSSPAVRYQRLVARKRSDAPSDKGEFEERDEREIGWGIARTIALADVMIPNETTIEDLRVSSRNVLERLRP